MQRLSEPNNLKVARVVAGLGVGEAAEKLGVTPQSIWHWETGRRTPRRSSLARMAELYDVAVDQLTGDALKVSA